MIKLIVDFDNKYDGGGLGNVHNMEDKCVMPRDGGGRLSNRSGNDNDDEKMLRVCACVRGKLLLSQSPFELHNKVYEIRLNIYIYK